jgi:hypothetical protein
MLHVQITSKRLQPSAKTSLHYINPRRGITAMALTKPTRAKQKRKKKRAGPQAHLRLEVGQTNLHCRHARLVDVALALQILLAVAQLPAEVRLRKD